MPFLVKHGALARHADHATRGRLQRDERFPNDHCNFALSSVCTFNKSAPQILKHIETCKISAECLRIRVDVYEDQTKALMSCPYASV